MRHKLALMLLMATGPALAASFDCTRAAPQVENQICANALLRKLDQAMNDNYRGAQATDIGRQARRDLELTQKRWLQERNRCKTDACIESSYRKRIDALCEYPAVSGVNWGCVSTSDDHPNPPSP